MGSRSYLTVRMRVDEYEYKYYVMMRGIFINCNFIDF